MAVEYRPLRAEEMRQFAYKHHLAFGESTADREIDRLAEAEFLQPQQTLGAFEDGELVSQMGTLPFTIRWSGRDIGCGGVTGVSTLPTHRRRGHLRELMTRAFAGMREEGQPVAMLWASMAAIYQRFGYGVAYTQYLTDFDPRHLRFVDEITVPGRTRMVKTVDALPVISGAYERFAEPRTLMMVRDETWWHRIVLRPWQPDRPPFLCAVYEEAGEVLGYTIYVVVERRRDQAGPSQRLYATLVWLTPAAHRALIRHLAGYDLADSIWIYRMPVDDPLFYHVQEPRLLNIRARDGTMVRIVDLLPALEGRGYDADGCLTFSFADDLCPWNAGTWALTAEGGVARVRRTDAAPELCLVPRALAILASGCQSASMLARIGLIPPADQRILAAADTLFRSAHAPLCIDHF